MSTYPLNARQADAVAHILGASALSDCIGVRGGRVRLVNGVLMLADLKSWSWSSGELVLIGVLSHIAQGAPMPNLDRLDEPNREIVREALDGLVTA